VTGATRGIGLGTARQLAGAGVRVLLAGRNLATATKAAEALQLQGFAAEPRRWTSTIQTASRSEKLSLEAFDSASEEEPSGYRFQILGEPLPDQFVLLGKLNEKMRRMLANTHVRDSDLGLQIVDETVRGRIEWDGIEDSRRPCVIIDGRRVEWDKLGRVLMPFEGWQFKLEVCDPSDEI